ncbi:hypothetical protein NTG1052_80052 [Candidatus Nitrotoga sp. 1052]|nr:hypothetical protein NTG1052_80052 [Candidatus Nitrotoga sp. 1052]
MSIDGKILGNPYVSVLELSNTGSRPILATDFEGPLKIAVTSPSGVVKVQLGATTPTSLEPKIDIAEGVVLVQPLLLNPHDVIRMTLVSANSRPEYSIRGRVAGVSEITTSDRQSSRAMIRNWLSKLTSTLLLVVYMVNMLDFAYAGFRKRPFLPFTLVTALVYCGL